MVEAKRGKGRGKKGTKGKSTKGNHATENSQKVEKSLGTIEKDSGDIHIAQKHCRNKFDPKNKKAKGQSLLDFAHDLFTQEIDIDNIPQIGVAEKNKKWYTRDTRRTLVYKALGIDDIPCEKRKWDGEFDKKLSGEVDATYKDFKTDAAGVKKFRREFAKKKLNADWDSKDNQILYIPREAIGWLIGTGGEVIRKTQNFNRVWISIISDPKDVLDCDLVPMRVKPRKSAKNPRVKKAMSETMKYVNWYMALANEPAFYDEK